MNIRNRSFVKGRGAAVLAALCLAASTAAGASVARFVEYVESDGVGSTTGEYVLLDYVPTSRSVVEARLALLKTNENQGIFCARGNSAGANTFTLFYIGGKGLRWDYNRTTELYASGIVVGSNYLVRCTSEGFWLDGNKVIDASPANYTPANKMMLFASYTCQPTETPVATGNYAKMRLYSFKAWDDDGATLSLALYPCVDTDGKAALYDVVNDKLYYNLKSDTDLTASATEVDDPRTFLEVTATPVACGAPYPAYGRVQLTAGEQIEATFPAAWTNEAGTIAAACRGWRIYDGLGNVIDSDSERSLTYVHPSPATYRRLEWVLDVECLVTSRAGANGTVPASEWVRYGEVATVAATPDAGYALGKWDGPLDSLRNKSNPLRFVVTGPVTNTAVFYPVVHVSLTGNDSNGGTSWSDAFKTISAAVGSCDTPYVLVSNGTYGVSADITIDKPAVVASLTGNPDDVKVRRASGNIHIFNLNHADAVVRGVAIQDGYFSGYAFQGPGVYIGAGGGAVEDCVIRNCTVSGDYTRGAIYMNSDYGRISRCVISNCVCTASSQGGAAISMAKGLVENCLVTRNQYNDSNSSHDRGIVTISGGTLQSCTIAGNSGKYFAGVCAANAAASISDCIIGGNTLTLSQTEANAVSCNNPASFVNCLAPVQINETCRTGDLGFQNAAAYDFHITVSSAALDAGSPAAASFLSDLDGFPRPSGAGPDIGCYEFDSSSASIALVADATEGLAPFAVNFSITVIGLSDAASYAWDLDGDGTADETTAVPSLSHTFRTSGSFAITVSALDALGAVLATSGNIVTVSAYPATVYVNASSATPAAPYDTPATAATTLQAALGATIGGATVLVADGAYPLTASVLIDKGVRVVGNDGDPSRIVFRRSGNANFRLFTLYDFLRYDEVYVTCRNCFNIFCGITSVSLTSFEFAVHICFLLFIVSKFIDSRTP